VALGAVQRMQGQTTEVAAGRGGGRAGAL
jgi:hypothetical protein